MATHQQMLNVAGTQSAMASEEQPAVRGNTCTVIRWHLEKTPVERKAQAERNAALEASVAATLRARFKVTPAELMQSETAWKEWLSKRSPDFISSWRDSLPASKPKQDEFEHVGEARFSKVVVAQHNKCILCEAMVGIRADPVLSHEQKMQRLRTLAHTVPKLLASTLTGVSTAVGTQNEPTFDNLVRASAWGHASAACVEEHPAVSRKGLFHNMLIKPENLEGTIDVQEGDWKLSRVITKLLVNSVGGDKEILDGVSNQEAVEQHPKAVKQRVNLYKDNKDAARSAIRAANRANCLSDDDIEIAVKAKAGALELERDLAILQSSLHATRARLEQVRHGCGRSVLEFNKKFCEMRRYKWRTGIDMEDEEDDDSPFGMIKMMRQEYQERRSLRGSSPPPGEGSPVSVGPPAPPALVKSPERQSTDSPAPAIVTSSSETHFEGGSTPAVSTESPEALIGEPSRYARTVQEFNRDVCEQEHNASVSTDSNSFGLKDALVVPTTYEDAGLSTGVATASSASGKSKAKKDSKVEGLLEEDGISLRDFAPEVEQKKGRSFRKLSVKAGSLSRPKTDPSSRPAWKP